MPLPQCTTWECINSFGSWLAALGTIATAALALWLAVRDRRIHLKAALTLGAIPSVPGGRLLDMSVFTLSITNVGPRPFTITNHCWKLPFVKGIVFLQPYMDTPVAKYCTKVPIELTDGKEALVFYPDDFFLNLESPDKFLFHHNKYIAWLRIRFFQLRIVTTAGARPKAKIARPVRSHLWHQYNGHNSSSKRTREKPRAA
jgi:hypothetical protein